MAQGSAFLQSDKVDAAKISFNTIFNAEFAALSRVDSQWDQLSFPVPSDTAIEQYNWMGMAPAFSKWDGERKISKLRNLSFQVQNADYANGIEVDENDLDDDKLGIYGPKIAGLAEMAMFHKVNLLVSCLTGGFSGGTMKSYDGVNFIGAGHQDGNGPSQTNQQAGVFSLANYQAARALMIGFQDENGEPIYADGTHLLVGPSNRALAKQVIEADIIGTTSNTEKGTAQLMVSPKLVGAFAGYWFLLDLKHKMKPILWQARRPVQFRSVVQGERQFMERKLLFGADGRYAANAAMWQYVVGSNGT